MFLRPSRLEKIKKKRPLAKDSERGIVGRIGRRINLLFSIKGFDDNGKNGLDRHTVQQKQASEQVLTGNWMEFTIHGRHYREKKPNPGRRWGQLLLCMSSRPTTRVSRFLALVALLYFTQSEWSRPLFFLFHPYVYIGHNSLS